MIATRHRYGIDIHAAQGWGRLGKEQFDASAKGDAIRFDQMTDDLLDAPLVRRRTPGEQVVLKDR